MPRVEDGGDGGFLGRSWNDDDASSRHRPFPFVLFFGRISIIDCRVVGRSCCGARPRPLRRRRHRRWMVDLRKGPSRCDKKVLIFLTSEFFLEALMYRAGIVRYRSTTSSSPSIFHVEDLSSSRPPSDPYHRRVCACTIIIFLRQRTQCVLFLQPPKPMATGDNEILIRTHKPSEQQKNGVVDSTLSRGLIF